MKSIIGLIFCICVFSSTACFAAQRHYHFASIEKLVEQQVGKIVLPKVYAKLNINITISPLPGKRAQLDAVSGRKDGEIMRIWSYGEENPNMVRVPTAYYSLETMPFFLKNRGIQIQSRQDLLNYSLVKVRGVKHTNNITEGMKNVSDVNNTEEMFLLITQGLADIALTNTLDGKLRLSRLENHQIIYPKNPLVVLKLYHYLNPKHKQLASSIDEEIQKMFASGEMKAIIQKAEQSVIQSYSQQ
ncbi:substrate-binding periplasmic protein [Algicola sagamiensis]|uniref:substrate-binding periplasmic protein n=1 Tax=Algicola sagamiensis TaxID=163869 RepID=UPI00036CBC95|nr:transporter substrate-binding domain-containing protein [Algicola sagamiensis]